MDESSWLPCQHATRVLTFFQTMRRPAHRKNKNISIFENSKKNQHKWSIMKKTVAGLPQAGAMVFALALAGCGGGGGGSDNPNPPKHPAPQTAKGVFKDSNVCGLENTTDGQTGYTNSSGGFTYEVVQQCTFRVCNVSLGATAGKALITPVDLVANGTGTSVEVENRVRFLMMLDDDGNPLNGINIVEAVRTRAQQWT